MIQASRLGAELRRAAALALAVCVVSTAGAAARAQSIGRSSRWERRNLASITNEVEFYGGGRIANAEEHFLNRRSAGIRGQLGDSATYLRHRMGINTGNNPETVLRTRTFPGLQPVRRFGSRYTDMVSPADLMTFRSGLFERRQGPYTGVVAREWYGHAGGAVASEAALPPESPYGPEAVGMQAVVRGSFDRTLAEGWGWFGEGEYGRAARSFEAAETIDRTRTESRLARLCCALGERNMAFAVRMFQRILLTDGPRLQQALFETDLKLAERFAPAERLEATVRMCESQAAFNKDAPDASALHAFMLWQTGRRAEAQSLADDIARARPESAAAQLPRLMRAAGRPNAGKPAPAAAVEGGAWTTR